MSVLELLRKRTKAREMSAHDFTLECVQLEARGKGKQIDVGRLESSMLEVGWTFSAFEGAVERERKLAELRGVVANLPSAAERFRTMTDHAREVQANADAETARLKADVSQAEQAVSQARAELDKCKRAEAELRALMESPARREARLAAKGPLSKLRRQQRSLEEEIVGLESTLANVDARTFTFAAERDAFIADRRKKLDRAQGKLADVAARLAQAEAEAGENQAEPEPAMAGG